MENKNIVVILLVIIAVLTLSLSISIGYIFIISGDSQDKLTDGLKETEENIPDIDELLFKSLFKEEKYFNLKQGNREDLNVIRVGIELVYYKKTKHVKNVEQLIESYDGAIKEIIGSYFQKMTLEQVKLEETKSITKENLKELINEFLNRGKNEKEREEIIYMVNFSDWFYQ